MDWTFYVSLAGVIGSIAALVFVYKGLKVKYPHKEVRIIRIDRASSAYLQYPWRPIVELGMIREELSDLRETNDDYSYSLQYRDYPDDAVQCDDCGGNGCASCNGAGWVPAGDPHGRLCEREECGNPIPPAQQAVYCSDECAFKDA